jgi:hypothetical protein
MDYPFEKKSQKLFFCEFCHYKSSNKYDFNKHLLTRKHETKKNDSKIATKIVNTKNIINYEDSDFFFDYGNNEFPKFSEALSERANCNSDVAAREKITKSDFSDKKINIDSDKQIVSKKLKEKEDNTCVMRWECICGKSYKWDSGFYRHKKKCNYHIKTEESKEILLDKEVLLEKQVLEKQVLENKELLKDNNKLNNFNELVIDLLQNQQKKIIELNEKIKEMVPKIERTNTINNTYNNKLNINVFLNEKCKDAINMSDFIQSIEVSLEQLEYTKMNGLEKGISNVILENMNKLSLYERPIHCTDMKRETLYIKDHNNWEKDYNKIKVKEIIKKTSSKNYQALQQWIKENPDYMNNEFKQTYFANAISTLGKPTNEIDEKIIKKICNKFTLKDN